MKRTKKLCKVPVPDAYEISPIPDSHQPGYNPHVNANRSWKRRICLPPRDTSFLQSNTRVNSRVHGLPGVVAPSFLSSASKGDECWWGTRDLSTIYLWDSMEDQDRRSSLEALRDKDNWSVWKIKDNKWTHELYQVVFH
jgi:hypothetical protein